jgi:hypothetical protein
MTTFTILLYTEEGFDCECCGYCTPEGISISVNDEEVWYQYTDNHMSGSQTEEPVGDCLIAGWEKVSRAAIEASYTEESRLAWNITYPGNSVASSPESWTNEKKEALERFEVDLAEVKENTSMLPYQIALQAKMIALWIESITGEVIDVVIDYERHADE